MDNFVISDLFHAQYSFPLILHLFIKTDQIHHFAETRTEAIAVGLLKLSCGEIGGNVCNQFFGDKQIISRQQNLGHYITFITKVLDIVFGTEVIKTEVSVFGVVQFPAAVAVDNLITVLYKLNRNITCVLHDLAILISR